MIITIIIKYNISNNKNGYYILLTKILKYDVFKTKIKIIVLLNS